MVSSAIWEKHARVSFSKTFKLSASVYFSLFAREIILLPVNNIKGNVREKHTLVVTS